MLWKCIRNLVPEYIYHRALNIEFKLQNVVLISEYEIKIYYKGELVGLRKVDFLVENIIPLEIKAATDLSDINIAQKIIWKLVELKLITYKLRSFKFAVQENDQ